MAVPLMSMVSAFVGRDPELAALQASLDEACAGRGGMALLAGEPGIGKTRLAEQLAAGARTRGVRVLWGRCYEGEGAPAFWPWIEILRAYVRGKDAEALRAELGPDAATIAHLVPEVQALLPEAPAPVVLDPEPARFRLFDSVTTLLFGAARRQPLLLILDDLHWADAPALLLLEFLARGLVEAPLMVIGAYREAEVQRGRPLARTLGELARRPWVARHTLSGLGVAEIGSLIALSRGPAISDAGASASLEPENIQFAAIVHRETEGNPFFVQELLRLLTAEGRFLAPAAGQIGRLRVPPTVCDVIGRRLDSLSAECNQALTVAAVLGREFSVELLKRSADLTGEALLGVLEEAEAAQIIAAMPDSPGRYRFSHALIREAIYEDLPAARRARLHLRAAEAIESVLARTLDAHASALAVHYRLAGAAATARKAIDYSRRAGEAAAAIFAWEEAVIHWQAALDLLEPADQLERVELLLALANGHTHSGNSSVARETYRQAMDIARASRFPERLARAVLGYAGRWSGTGSADATTVAMLEEALVALGEQDSVLRARTLARLTMELRFSDQQERRRLLSQDAVDMARRLGDAATLVDALNARQFVLWGPEGLDERLALASEVIKLTESAGERELLLPCLRYRLVDRLELGDLAGVDHDLEAYGQVVETLRLSSDRWRPLLWSAMRAQLSGRFADAEQLAQRALASGRAAQSRDVELHVGTQLLILQREQEPGRDETVSAFQRLAERYSALPVFRAFVALCYCDAGRVAEARLEFEQFARRNFAGLPQDANWLNALTTLAHVCAFLEDRTRAERLYDLLLPYARRFVVAGAGIACFGAVAYPLALLATVLKRWEAAEQHFEMALELNARLGALPLLAQTRCEYSRLLLSRGRKRGSQDRALAMLAQALDAARALGMEHLSQQITSLQFGAHAVEARAELARASALPDGLTAREVEVLHLISAGKTNREIANLLVVSPKTVMHHSVSIYRKIGARGRAEATAYALRHDLATPPSSSGA